MDDPQFVTYLRIGYVSAQLLALAIYYYVTIQIRRKNDLTVLKYVNPPSAMVSGDQGRSEGQRGAGVGDLKMRRWGEGQVREQRGCDLTSTEDHGRGRGGDTDPLRQSGRARSCRGASSSCP
jgi:hypothetical protein